MSARAWGSVVCDGKRSQSAVHSWFSWVVPDAWGLPIKADVQEEIDTGRETAMRALYRTPEGALMEVLRRKNRGGFTMHRRPASRAILKDFRQ